MNSVLLPFSLSLLPPIIACMIRVAWLGSVLVAFSLAVRASADEVAGIEFFEKNIRPVLSRHCLECHSSKLDEPKSKLRLDSRDAGFTASFRASSRQVVNPRSSSCTAEMAESSS